MPLCHFFPPHFASAASWDADALRCCGRAAADCGSGWMAGGGDSACAEGGDSASMFQPEDPSMVITRCV